MSQKKNCVVLSSTAIARLQKLVESGEYCSIDDAANFVVMSVLSSTGLLTAEFSPKNESTQQYSAVLVPNLPKSESSQMSTEITEPKSVAPSLRTPLTGL